MDLPLYVLFVANSQDDVSSVVRELRHGGYQVVAEQVATATAMLAALQRQSWDLAIVDYSVSGLTVPTALQVWQLGGTFQPLLLLIDSAAEDAALDLMPAGVNDYVFKDKLKRLLPVVTRELQASANRRHQQQAEAALFMAQGNHDWKEVERLKTELIAVVNHEFRTPLAVIKGVVELLLTGVIGELPLEGQRMLDIATKNIDRLVYLMDNFFDLEQIRTGTMKLHKQPCDVTELLQQAVVSMQETAIAANVQLGITPLSAQIMADPKRIVQVLAHLISNAIKFSQAGDRVWVRAKLQYPGIVNIPSPTVIISIKDVGEGIPPESLQTIFEEFRLVDGSDSRRCNGIGLGLSVSRGIVWQHGGDLWAESRPGQGSTFYLALPAMQSATNVAMPRISTPLATSPGTAPHVITDTPVVSLVEHTYDR